MSKLEVAIAGALALISLSSCGSREPAAANYAASAAAAGAAENAASADPVQPGAPADRGIEAVPPPDAVSHPDGYLPPAPAEPGTAAANSAGPQSPPPATEDQYIRNGQ